MPGRLDLRIRRFRMDCTGVWVSQFERVDSLRSACELMCACGVRWHMRCQREFIGNTPYNVEGY